MYDIVIKGGKVIDPGQQINKILDVAVKGGKIVALMPDIPSDQAKDSINAKGFVVTPGLIDLHTHAAEAIMPLAANPDEIGVETGVTTVLDAGSTGYANFNGFKKLIIPKATTDIFCLINLSPTGQAIIPEICWQNLNPELIIELIEENRDIIRGIKFRAGAGAIKDLGIRGIEISKGIAAKVNLPIAVHIGIGLEEEISKETVDAFTSEMLSRLDRGDILVHPYTHRIGGAILPDGTVMAELKEAVNRGVVIDVSPGSSHFSFEICRIGMDNGVMPTTISTDTVNTNMHGPVVFSLPVIMSKFLALGLTLEEVIEKTTIAPAKVIGEEIKRGTLNVNQAADISVIEIKEGDYLFSDGNAGNTLSGKHLIEPKVTLKSGAEIAAKPRFRNFVPGEQIHFPKGT
jgi:dihydroorotase